MVAYDIIVTMGRLSGCEFFLGSDIFPRRRDCFVQLASDILVSWGGIGAIMVESDIVPTMWGPLLHGSLLAAGSACS